jgi:hypothetical protein
MFEGSHPFSTRKLKKYQTLLPGKTKNTREKILNAEILINMMWSETCVST